MIRCLMSWRTMGYISNITVEEKSFLSHLSDLCTRAEERGHPCFVGFLDERQQAICEGRIPSWLSFRFWGGYPDAQRKWLGVSSFDQIEEKEFPISCIQITFRKQDELSHRDFLGAVLALNIERQQVGDILTASGEAYLFVSSHMVPLILSELVKVGRVGVHCELYLGEVSEIKQNFAAVSGTVTSLRLDCVTAFLISGSRSASTAMIAQKLIMVNGTAQSGTYQLQEGDKISIRGTGKFIFDGQTGQTRKNRLHVRFRKYC